MTISFSRIPANIRVPGTYFEFTPKGGAGGQEQVRALVIGQVLAGSAMAASAANAALCLGTADTRNNAGPGSMLALMVAQAENRYSAGEHWILPLLDDPAAVAATGTITFAGTATSSGTLPLYIDGQLVPVLVTLGMTAAQLAAAVVAAAVAFPDLPVTLSVAAAVLTATAKNKGLAGNDLDLRIAYLGARGGEVVPPGITCTIAPMAGGSQNPSLTVPLLNLGDQKFEVIYSPYSDPASLAALGLFMDDNTGRWAFNRKIYGHVYCPRNSAVSQAQSYGAGLNNQHITILPIFDTPMSPPEQVAAWGAGVFQSVAANPSIPLQYIPTNIPLPPQKSRFVFQDRQTLLFNGMSTYREEGGVLEIERLITTYQLTPAGVPDASYLDAETMHQLGFAARDLDAYMLSKYGRAILVADDVAIPGGSAMVNPSLLKAAMDTRYRYQCEVLQLCQDPDGFAKESRVELAGAGRANFYAPFRLMGQLRAMAFQVGFSKPT